MYEDAWYSFVPELHPKKDVAPQPLKHRRRASLLQQPNSSNQLPDQTEPILELFEDVLNSRDPPAATLARRAKSYSNFYEVAVAYATREEKKDILENGLDVAAGISMGGVPFESRYGEFENDILDASHEEYQLYLDQLALSERHLDTLLEDTTSSLDLLASLSESFKAVEAQTVAFQAQCEDLLAEQKRLCLLADEVGTDLQYYSYLEPLTRRLNSPGAARLVQNDDFLEMLRNLNMCIEFMEEHPNFRDATIYKTRYLSLLQKALNFVYVTFDSTLQTITEDIANRLRATSLHKLTDTEIYVLVYGRFKTAKDSLSAPLKAILDTTEFAFQQNGLRDGVNRSPHVALYRETFDKLIQSYLQSRSLVRKLVSETLKQYSSGNPSPSTDFQAFARKCILFVLEICDNEDILACHFFVGGALMGDRQASTARQEAWDMTSRYADELMKESRLHLATLLNFLEPYLRNGNLNRICGISTWLKSTFVATDVVYSKKDNGKRNAAQAFLSDHLWPLADELFIKTASEIANFKPSTTDLKTTNLNQPVAGTKRPGSSGSGDHLSTGASAIPGILYAYPTVKTAVDLLLLYSESMHESTQQKGEVLYEIVNQATESVQKAATLIKRSNPTKNLDAQVFVIKNLMIIEHVFMTHELPDSIRQSTELDFRPFWNTMKELQSKQQFLNPLAYIAAMWGGRMLPAVVKKVLDAREKLERVLEQQIRSLAEHWKARFNESGSRKGDEAAKLARELEAFLRNSFDDETTRTALGRMIRGEAQNY